MLYIPLADANTVSKVHVQIQSVLNILLDCRHLPFRLDLGARSFVPREMSLANGQYVRTCVRLS